LMLSVINVLSNDVMSQLAGPTLHTSLSFLRRFHCKSSFSVLNLAHDQKFGKKRTANNSSKDNDFNHGYHRKYKSSAIRKDDAKYIREWASKNREAAAMAMNVPPLTSIRYYVELSNDSSNLDDENYTMEEYLKWRGWGFISQKDNIHNSSKLGNLNKEGIRVMTNLVSHALTYPLTLGSHSHNFIQHAQEMIKQQHQDEEKREQQTKLVMNLCCVGARSESSLPLKYWREMLIIANRNHCIHCPDYLSINTIEWVIDFIGPEICSSSTQTISLPPNTISGPHQSITLRSHKYYLHQYIIEQYKTKKVKHEECSTMHLKHELKNKWDGYIFFNPGIGHTKLSKFWIPTLKFVSGTRKPILFTAHSDYDSDRDGKILSNIFASPPAKINEAANSPTSTHSSHFHYADTDIGANTHHESFKYKVNPYAGKMEFEDQFQYLNEENKTNPSSTTKTEHNFESHSSDIGMKSATKPKFSHFVRPNDFVLFLSHM